ncbi:MAG: hypothetical protein ABFR97_08705 [Thermodesulfobacteriota bacterium]
MLIPQAEKHKSDAIALYKQRLALLAETEVEARRLANLERRLRLHLHVLGQIPSSAEQKPPSQEADTFVFLASGLSSANRQTKEQTFSQACKWLVDNGPEAAGAYAALAYISPEDPDNALTSIYREQAKLRPQLFKLWRKQRSQEVEPGLINRAELQNRDHDLQGAALAFAAENKQVGVELFRSYYKGLTAAHSAKPPALEVMAKALWGGLLRGDVEAAPALRRAVELESDPSRLGELLRLGALIGDEKLLPVLASHQEQKPAQGTRLLALHGSRAAMEIIIDCLQQPATADYAAKAWQWLTGTPLAGKPRLHLVDDEEQGSSKTRPDHEAATAWWLEHKESVPQGQRWFRGKALDRQGLLSAATTQAGQAGRDILNLLALQTGEPLGVSPEAEQLSRQQIIKSLAQAGQNPQP